MFHWIRVKIVHKHAHNHCSTQIKHAHEQSKPFSYSAWPPIYKIILSRILPSHAYKLSMFFIRTSFACSSKNCCEGAPSSSPAWDTNERNVNHLHNYCINWPKRGKVSTSSVENLKDLMKKSTNQGTGWIFIAFQSVIQYRSSRAMEAGSNLKYTNCQNMQKEMMNTCLLL